jgi:hypothetical protein
MTKKMVNIYERFDLAGAGGGTRKDCKRHCGFGGEENLEEQS